MAYVIPRTVKVVKMLDIANTMMDERPDLRDGIGEFVSEVLVSLGAYAGRDSNGHFLVHERIKGPIR
jgi:hypothetical protein